MKAFLYLLLLLSPTIVIAHASFELSSRVEGNKIILFVDSPDVLSVRFLEGDRELCLDRDSTGGFTCDVTSIVSDMKPHQFTAEGKASDGDTSTSVVTLQLTASGLVDAAKECGVDNIKAATFPKRIEILGSCPPGSAIELTITSEPVTKSVRSDSNGKFKVSLTEDIGPGIHSVKGSYAGGELKATVPETIFCVGTRDECEALGYEGELVVEEPAKLANRVYGFILATALLLSASVIMALKRTRIG